MCILHTLPLRSRLTGRWNVSRRDVKDVIHAVYDFGFDDATTDELTEVVEWIEIELDRRAALSPLPQQQEPT